MTGLHEALLQYDWRLGNAQGIDKFSAEIDSIAANPAGHDRELLFRLGTYLQHHKKDSLRAIDVLEVAQHEFRHSHEDNKCYEVGNNLAYAIVDALVHGKIKTDALEKLSRAAELIHSTSVKSKDPETLSFALRIHGQIFFFMASTMPVGPSKQQHLENGVATCLRGIEKLDLKNKRLLTEAARTYNRNGDELLKYSRQLNAVVAPENDRLLLARAATQVLSAQQLWDTLPAAEVPEYRARTNFTLGNIFIEKSRLDGGNREHLQTARDLLAKSVAQFAKAGNQKFMAEARALELKVAGQIRLIPAARSVA